jgi:WD40 repeat protein/nucleoside phosphorylase
VIVADTAARADVVILTAIPLELDAVLAVDTGAVPGSAWSVITSAAGLPVAFRSFVAQGGRPVRVAAAVSADMGATAAVHALVPLASALRPRCIAMCGVCAGRPGKTRLGDVVAADRLFFHDTGKQLSRSVERDLTTYQLRDDWKLALERFDPAAQFRDAAWLHRRPLTTEWREHRALVALRDGAVAPWNAVEPDLGAQTWAQIVEALRERKLLAASAQRLTDKGRRLADKLVFDHGGALPDLSPIGAFQPFRLHVAPMGSGTRVLEDEAVWGFVSQAMRKTLALEMEAAVVGELAHRLRLDGLVMKGVMDFADHGRDDHFKRFAARASAECLLWFLRHHAPLDVAPGIATAAVSITGARALPSDRLNYDIERGRHGGFVGRGAILAALDRLLLDEDTDRWVVVTGGPGVGKSAILSAWLARRAALGEIVPHHFIRRGLYGWDEPAKITASLAAQIEAQFPSQRDADARPDARLADLLVRVSARELQPHRKQLVLLIDGLDEYDNPTGAGDPLAAFLPHALPHGIRILCASRPRHPYLEAVEARGGELRRIDLDDPASAEDNDATVRAFWRREVVALGLDDRFTEEAVDRADGNMQHAVMLRKHLASVPRAQWRADAIPRGLDSLITLLWARVARSAIAVQGVGVLCAAREPLTLDELGAVAGWGGFAERDELKRSALELLTERRRDDGAAAYRLHHDSIRAHIVNQVGPAAVRGHHAALARTLATWPAPADGVARRYALRHALAHRAEASDWSALGQLARDLGFLETKCRELGVHEVEADVARAAELCRADGDEAIGRDLIDLARALARESHWLRDDPGALAVQLWNRLRRLGWGADEVMRRLHVPPRTTDLVRVRHVVSRESPALLRNLTGHAGGVGGCAVSCDGGRVVSGSGDNTLRIWDLDSGRVLSTLVGHAQPVMSCAITPDGRRAVSASRDRTLKVWDLDTARVIFTLQGHTRPVTSCAVTPDGRCVISTSGDNTLKVWDLETGRMRATLEGHTSAVWSCAITPDGRRVVSASGDRTLRAWDLDTGGVLSTFEGHTDSVTSCAITPDGRRVVSGASDNTLRVWELDTGRAVSAFTGHTDAVMSCAVTRDGHRVVSASSDKTLKVWDLDAGRVLATLEGHADSVTSAAVIVDGRRVVSASDDKTLKVWDLDIGCVAAPVEGHTDLVTSCAVTPDGRRVISASGDRTLKVWDLDTGCVLATLEGHTARVTSCAATPDGRRVISASGDNTLKVWDLETGRVLSVLQGQVRRATGCAVTPDGRLAILASSDGALKLWELDTERVFATLRGHTGGVTSCAITPDGRRVVSASEDTTLKLWELETGRLIHTLEGHGDAVMSCAITPDGRRVVSASDDTTLKLWDLETGRVLATLEGHTAWVASCAVSPDGRRAASASGDNTLKVWDLETATCLATHLGDAPFTAVAVTATTICAGDAAGALWILDVPCSWRAPLST